MPEDVLEKIRYCIRRGNLHHLTVKFEDRVSAVLDQIINHNTYQVYIDQGHPIGDDADIRAELLLDTAQQVENAIENMGGADGIKPPIHGPSGRSENAVQTTYVILDSVVCAMNEAGRVVGDDFQSWWSVDND